MTEEEFQVLISKSKMHEQSIPIARDYLVHGMRIIDLVKKYGKTRQAIASILKFAIDRKKKVERVPDDWKTVTVTVPPDIATEIKTLAWKCKERLGYGKPIPIEQYRQKIAELEKRLFEEQKQVLETQEKMLQTQEEIIAEKKKLLKMEIEMQEDNYHDEEEEEKEKDLFTAKKTSQIITNEQIR